MHTLFPPDRAGDRHQSLCSSEWKVESRGEHGSADRKRLTWCHLVRPLPFHVRNDGPTPMTAPGHCAPDHSLEQACKSCAIKSLSVRRARKSQGGKPSPGNRIKPRSRDRGGGDCLRQNEAVPDGIPRALHEIRMIQGSCIKPLHPTETRMCFHMFHACALPCKSMITTACWRRGHPRN